MHKIRMSTIIFEAAMTKIKHHKNLTQRNYCENFSTCEVRSVNSVNVDGLVQ